MLERCHQFFSMTLNIPLGVGFSDVPDEIGDSAIATPASYKVTVCFVIETISNNGPVVGGGASAARSCSMTFRLVSRAPFSSGGGPVPKYWRGLTLGP